MEGGVTVFDAIILGVLLLSGLLALVRGFIRETLSVAAFVAAAFGALWMLPVLQGPVRGVIQPGWLADIAAVVGTFLLIYLAVTLVTSSISKQLRGGDEPGLLDRLGGLVFGIGRGLVLLALFVIGFTAIAPADRPQTWLTEARLYPVISATAVALRDLAPDSSQIAATPIPPPASERPAAARAPLSPDRAAPAATAAPAPADEGVGYGETTRRSLDQLIGARAADEDDGDAP